MQRAYAIPSGRLNARNQNGILSGEKSKKRRARRNLDTKAFSASPGLAAKLRLAVTAPGVDGDSHAEEMLAIPWKLEAKLNPPG